MSKPLRAWRRAASLCLCLCLWCACAEIPSQRYGIESLRFRGMRELDSEALRACLASEQRDKVTLGLGALISPSCGKPPFDKSRWSGRLFALPWTDWPVYDEALLKLDLDRVERWYHARGFYGVRVLDVAFEPSAARTSDGCEGDDCTVEITVQIQEGKPVRIRKLALDIEGELSPALREDVEDALELENGEIFDEGLYDEAREALARALREEGYARAKVDGEVVVNRGLLVADIHLKVVPGPLCHMGAVRVTKKGDIPEAPVLAATLLRRGQLYRESELDDAQRAIYALGAFSAVTVRGDLEHSEGPEIPILIDLEPRRRSQVMVGVGILSGTVATGIAAEEGISVPQWDVHLLGSYEHRNFFGDLRRFRVEDRPRMLFLDTFPSVPGNSPRFGNTLLVNFSQPGAVDPRTNLFVEARWDNGPDPFLLFFRNDIGLALGLERGFFRQRLNARAAIHQEIMEVARRQPITEELRDKLRKRWSERVMELVEDGELAPGVPLAVGDRESALYEDATSYRLPFLEQRLTLDLRDDSANPTRGAYFRVSAHEAVRIWDPSWNYLRLMPEARGYAPIGLGMVLAARFALGSLHIFSASGRLDQQSRRLGAQAYRLRGGGATSNRGFLSGQLGDGVTGGVRRWEASLELRIPLSKSFYIVGFSDMGDVNSGLDIERQYDPVRNTLDVSYTKRRANFRFSHLNTAVGGGLRYHTVIGPIRLDVGYRPKQLAGDARRQSSELRQIKGFDGAIHLTIGESF